MIILQRWPTLIWLGTWLVLVGCQADVPAPSPRFSLEPIPGRVILQEAGIFIDSPAVLQSKEYFVWGGSVIQGEDERYYMFFSVFDSGPENPPFSDAWLLSSKIAWAISDRPDRGFVFQDILMQGAKHLGHPEAWDAQMVHNPHIQKFQGKYYLYYIGSRDPGPQPPGTPGADLRMRDRIQQVQKIGVITCGSLDDLVSGNFARPEKSLLTPRTRVKKQDVISPSPPGTQPKPDNLVVVNPSVVYRPSDGKYLLYFKGNLYDPDWRGVHGVAIGDSPTGPFQAQDEFVFDVRMADGRLAKAEDPYVWHHPGSGLFYGVFKDFTGRITQSRPGLALMASQDGISWSLTPDPLFSALQLEFEDGTIIQVAHLERPQLLINGQGIPVAFYAACSLGPVGTKTDGSTFNVQMRVSLHRHRD